MKQVIPVPELRSYEDFGFSQCVKSGNLIFVTGQAGIDKQGTCVAEDMTKQAERTFENIQFALKAAGSNLENILSMTCYIVDIASNGPAFWSVRKRIMPKMAYTSASIGVAALADPKLLLEIQCVAEV